MPDKPIIFLAFANDKVDNARYLRNLPLEMSGIRKALYEAEDAGLCEVLERANATIEDILDIFQDNRYKDRIAIFHYGGHADGYQLLLEQLDGSHAIAHGTGLVSFLAKQKGLKLIFFNGCSTQQQALELVQGGVPIVVGTSQAISDDVATSLSIRFYSGLANGASIERAWAEAIDLVKIQKGTENTRGLYRKAATQEVEDRFPWEMHIRTGAEVVKQWNLPEAVENPLFGLPEIPNNYDLPDEPFIFLGRYERKHAEVFFGRSYYIRDLYNRISSKNSAPVILLYGQSGVGKSSLLDAGLLPRLESDYHVTYIRRKRDLGLAATLREALDFKETDTNGHAQNGNLNGNGSSNGNGKEHGNGKIELQYDANFLRTMEQVSQLESIALNADDVLQKELLGVINRFKKQKEEVFTLEAKRDRILQAKTVAKEIQELHESRRGTATAIFNEKRFQQTDTEDNTDANSLLRFWKAKEKKLKKPVVVILDQVEEVFTQPNFDIPDELEMFLEDLDLIFKNPQNRPKGKVILSYRKEYHPEIEELLKIHAIPRENIFLTHLDRKDIAEVVTGLTKTEKLKKKYRLEVQDKLAEIIADDMLEDKDSSIAPVLQILLTKMWNLIQKDEYKAFSVDKYQELRKEGVLLGDFFYQQMGKLRAWNPELEQSGLALDLLNFHTTNLGTADTRTLEEIGVRYGGRSEVLDLLLICKDLYLLTDRSSDTTGLAHDTLAPLIQNEYKNSDRAGQRAARILESKVVDFEDNKKMVIDPMDLGLVEVGEKGMRAWKEDEQRLVVASRKKRRKKRILNNILIFSIFLVTGIIAVLGVFANREREKAVARREQAEEAQKRAEAERKNADYQKTKAIAAMDSFNIQRIKAEDASFKAFREQMKAVSATQLAQRQEQIAKEQQKKAEAAQVEAKLNSDLAAAGEFQAHLKTRQAEQQGVEAKMGEFTAKAKELAILSIAQIENTGMKNRMALTSYQLQESGIKNAMREVANIKTQYEDTTKFKRKDQRIPAYGRSYRLLLALQDRLNRQSQTNVVPAEIFASLRNAYIADNPDMVQSNTESWTMGFTKDNELIFNGEGNGLKKGLLVSSLDGLPQLRGIEAIATEDNRNSPRNILVVKDKIYCSTAEGKILSWNNQNQQEILVSYPQKSILALAFSEIKNQLFYTIGSSIYRYDLKSKVPIEVFKNASSIRQITLIEDNNNSFLAYGDEQGNISSLDLSANSPTPKVLYKQTNRGIYSMVYLPKSEAIVAGDAGGRLIALLYIKPENLLKADFVPRSFSDKKHKGIVRTISTSADGRFLATGGWDGSLLLWDTEMKVESLLGAQPILEVQHEGKILATQFDTNGQYLFFSDENSIHICPTRPRAFYELLCKKVKQEKEEPKEWKDFYNREDNKIIKSDCKCVSCQ